MSTVYASFYTMSHIPCPESESSHDLVSQGLAQMNIDGKPVQGGIKVGGQCISGFTTNKAQGIHIPGNKAGLAGLSKASAANRDKGHTGIISFNGYANAVAYSSDSQLVSSNLYTTHRFMNHL
jgi:hypothetical protein